MGRSVTDLTRVVAWCSVRIRNRREKWPKSGLWRSLLVKLGYYGRRDRKRRRRLAGAV